MTNKLNNGEEFGYLTIVGGRRSGPYNHSLYSVRCKCGNEIETRASDLRRGITTSCGCRKIIQKTHGLSKHPLYNVRKKMIHRCYDPAALSYRYYGAKGIEVCERWLASLEYFIEDMGDRPTPGHQIHRKDHGKDYEPDNCIWMTPCEASAWDKRHAKA